MNTHFSSGDAEKLSQVLPFEEIAFHSSPQQHTPDSLLTPQLYWEILVITVFECWEGIVQR